MKPATDLLAKLSDLEVEHCWVMSVSGRNTSHGTAMGLVPIMSRTTLGPSALRTQRALSPWQKTDS
jgi:hypothetical protein